MLWLLVLRKGSQDYAEGIPDTCTELRSREYLQVASRARPWAQ